jgi:hypothetical protein
MLNASCADAHGDYYEHCTDCKADHDALMDVLAQQAGEAAAIVGRMKSVGVNVPQEVFVAARVEALMEALLVTRRARLAFEYAAGAKTLDQLRDGDEALKEATKVKIATPAQGGLVVPPAFRKG